MLKKLFRGNMPQANDKAQEAIDKTLKSLNLDLKKRVNESAENKIKRIIDHIQNNGISNIKISDKFSHIDNTYYDIDPSKIPKELIFLDKIIKSHMPTNKKNKYNSTFTVAYEGLWGTGKTSRIKFFCNHFKYNHIYINLWKFADIDDLYKIKEMILMEVLSSIRPITGSLFKMNQLIEAASLTEDKVLKKKLKGIGGSIGLTTASAGLSLNFDHMKKTQQTSLSKLTLDKAPEKLGEISHLVRQTLATFITNKPLILVLDDIDRVNPKSAYNILQAIRSVLEINGIISIVPINKNKILNRLLEKEANTIITNKEQKNMKLQEEDVMLKEKINFMDKFFNYSIFSANNQILNKGDIYEQAFRNRK